MVYRHKTSPSPRKFELIASARKALSTIFWDMKGVVHMEFLKQGHTVNFEKYISTLRILKARLRRVRSGRDSILRHDNARPHTSRQTQDALAQLKLPALVVFPLAVRTAPVLVTYAQITGGTGGWPHLVSDGGEVSVVRRCACHAYRTAFLYSWATCSWRWVKKIMWWRIMGFAVIEFFLDMGLIQFCNFGV